MFTLATYSICVQMDEIIHCSSQQTLCTAWQIYSATAIESGCVIALKVIMTVGVAGLEVALSRETKETSVMYFAACSDSTIAFM